jgi:prophage antirepressor-like protein
MKTKLVVFQDKEIRKTLHNGEWWFAIVDVVSALTDSLDPSGYIKDMRRRDGELSKGWGQIATPLSIETSGGKQRINCANTEGLFRIIQSIPSPKAEPFKRWLAKVGYERVQEIESPPAPLFQSGVTIGQRLSVGLLFASPFDKGGLRGISEELRCLNTISS